MEFIYWILIILGVIILYIIVAYNSLIVLRTRISNAWSQIDVQLKRRYDLIPNLISTVKGYVKHEKTVLNELTKARSNLIKGSMESKARASNQITDALKSVFAVAENYPQLKANENFKLLQEELSGTESKIAYARQFYNDSVMSFNIKVQRFPTSIIANAFNFKEKEFFKAEGKEKENIKVEF
ncbi:LemA family protein [Candidatus Woesearchaeota archaeon]|nr:LemA family protein [Candidatus Woesearchaeota archaeon]